MKLINDVTDRPWILMSRSMILYRIALVLRWFSEHWKDLTARL